MAKQLNFEYKGRPYCLEYTRTTVTNMEAMGFDINELASKMMIRVPQLFEGAFMAHHSSEKPATIKAIYKATPDKNNLILRLREMYLATYDDLLDDPAEGAEGNVTWTANWKTEDED